MAIFYPKWLTYYSRHYFNTLTQEQRGRGEKGEAKQTQRGGKTEKTPEKC